MIIIKQYFELEKHYLCDIRIEIELQHRTEYIVITKAFI